MDRDFMITHHLCDEGLQWALELLEVKQECR
jgi:hypothetical protein